MELEDMTIFYPAIVEKKTVNINGYVTLQFRLKKRSLFADSYPSREIRVVWISDDEIAKRQFVQAKKLRAGDEFLVEAYYTELCKPKYLWFGRRWWNLLVH
jgi:hypothetical protein